MKKIRARRGSAKPNDTKNGSRRHQFRAKPKVLRRYRSAQLNGSITMGDALLFLGSLQTESADIVFLDPPFNLGKSYSSRRPRLDALPDAEYQRWITDILTESTRILRPGGTLFLYHLPMWAIRFGAHLDGPLRFKHWIAISMKNGFIRGRKLYPAHYALLMFSKGDPTQFTRPKLKPSRCRHCGEYIKDYGGYLPIIEAKGINLSDFWEDLSPVRHANRKYRRANELPELLFNRVVEISGSPNALYVDPFAGTGSGVIAAAFKGMRFAACDLFEENCEIICQRLSAIQPQLNGNQPYA